jgi:hypothetical protein
MAEFNRFMHTNANLFGPVFLWYDVFSHYATGGSGETPLHLDQPAALNMVKEIFRRRNVALSQAQALGHAEELMQLAYKDGNKQVTFGEFVDFAQSSSQRAELFGAVRVSLCLCACSCFRTVCVCVCVCVCVFVAMELRVCLLPEARVCKHRAPGVTNIGIVSPGARGYKHRAPGSLNMKASWSREHTHAVPSPHTYTHTNIHTNTHTHTAPKCISRHHAAGIREASTSAQRHC